MPTQYEGGYVKEPISGLHKNLIVIDFRSLYPSIIVTHNIDVKTFDCPHRECKKNKVPGFPDRWFCTKVEGGIPKRIKKILADRVEVKKQLKKAKGVEKEKLKKREQQLKLAANISYGYFGYRQSPYYNVKVAESISAFGRHYLKSVISTAEKEDFTVIYADTDGVFLKDGEKNSRKFLDKINKKLPGIIRLEFRGVYKKGLFVTRKTGAGAKKKYALIDSKGKLTIRGFETRREDWSMLAKSMQEKILKLILLGEKKEAIKYAKSVIANLEKGKIKKQDLIITEQITKPLSQYKATGPHTEAARKMEAQGKKVPIGTFVKYFISKGTQSISERAEPEYSSKEPDYNYYVTNQIIPAALRVLADFGVTEKDLIEGGLKKFLKNKKK